MRLTHATHQAMKYACTHWHYSKSVPSVVVCGYNVYEGDVWCGVIIYGNGANINGGKQFNLIQGQWVELCRVALNGKQEHTSQAVAMSLKELKKDKPMCRLVLSYADCDQSHLGTIYQATNWVYCGKMEGQRYFKVGGVKMHPKTIWSHKINDNGTIRRVVQSLDDVKQHLDPNAEIIHSMGKHKYLMPMDKEMRKQIAPLAQPYPKNDDWVKIDRTKFKEAKDGTDNEIE